MQNFIENLMFYSYHGFMMLHNWNRFFIKKTGKKLGKLRLTDFETDGPHGKNDMEETGQRGQV